MTSDLQLRILEILDKEASQTGGIANSSDEEIAKQIKDFPLNEIRHEIRNLRDLDQITCEIAGENLLFVGITGKGSERVRKELKNESDVKYIETTTPRPPYIPHGSFGTLTDSTNRDEFGFGEPIYVEGSKRNISESFLHKHKMIIISIIISVTVGGLYFGLNHVIPPSVQNGLSVEPFPANITASIDEPVIVNLSLNGASDTKVDITIQGVVPHSGVITLRLDNYTFNPQQYNASAITINRLFLQKNEQIPVTPNQPIQQTVGVILTPYAFYSSDYAHKGAIPNNESYVGTITFSADYYDQVTKTTKSYTVTSKLKAKMLGLPIGN